VSTPRPPPKRDDGELAKPMQTMLNYKLPMGSMHRTLDVLQVNFTARTREWELDVMRILIACVRSPAGPARCRSVHMRLPSTSWTCSESASHCPSLMHHLLWDTHPMFTYPDVHLYGSRDIGPALEPICKVDTPQGGGTCRRQPDASRPDIFTFLLRTSKGNLVSNGGGYSGLLILRCRFVNWGMVFHGA
jgi:hypothetical protein